MEKTVSFAKGILFLVAAVGFISGFLLLDFGVTGNAIISEDFSIAKSSLLGLLVVIISFALAFYATKK